jgi:hypothetical protein
MGHPNFLRGAKITRAFNGKKRGSMLQIPMYPSRVTPNDPNKGS